LDAEDGAAEGAGFGFGVVRLILWDDLTVQVIGGFFEPVLFQFVVEVEEFFSGSDAVFDRACVGSDGIFFNDGGARDGFGDTTCLVDHVLHGGRQRLSK